MPALANVAITDTFDTWRIRTNQLIVKTNDDEVYSTAAYDKANSANVLAYNTGIGANTFLLATLSGANTAVGTGANAFSSATIAGANTAVGTGANTVSTAAFNKANNALANSTGTFVGDLNVTGNVSINSNLSVSGTVSTASANVLSQTLTDAATINWNISSGQIATVTLGGNRTMAAPTNLRVGTLILHVIQDGTGGRTLTWNSVFKWPAGVAPVLTTTGGRRDMFSFVCDGTNLYGSFLPDVR